MANMTRAIGSDVLCYDRPFDPDEATHLAAYNVGLSRILACSAHYSAPFPYDQATDRIRDALQVMQSRVPVLTTVVSRHPDTKEPYYCQLQNASRPQLDVMHLESIDPESRSYRDQVGLLMAQSEFPVREGIYRPAWRAILLLEGTSDTSTKFGGRVLFLASHVLFDGLSITYLHELLSELLCDPEHPYWCDIPEAQPLSRPSLDSLWQFRPSVLELIKAWWLNRVVDPLRFFYYSKIAQRFTIDWSGTKASSADDKMTIRTVMLDKAQSEKIRLAGRSEGATFGNIMSTALSWAIQHTARAHAHRFSKDLTWRLFLPMTMRPGSLLGSYSQPSLTYDAVMRRDEHLQPSSAFHRQLGICQGSLIGLTDTNRSFWDTCRAQHQVTSADNMLSTYRSIKAQERMYWFPKRAEQSQKWKDDPRGPTILNGLEPMMTLRTALQDDHAIVLVASNTLRTDLRQSDEWTVRGLTWCTRDWPKSVFVSIGGDGDGSFVSVTHFGGLFTDDFLDDLMAKFRMILDKIRAGQTGPYEDMLRTPL